MEGKGDRRKKEEVKRRERRVCKRKKETKEKEKLRLEGREGDSQGFRFLHLRGWQWAGGD